jgi:magnesium-dependent phosphatase-1
LVALVIFDCDRTLWSDDVSTLRLPFRRINDDSLEDSVGKRLTLSLGAKSILLELNRRGIICSIASWNEPDLVREALTVFGISGLFTEPVVEYHQEKDRMVREVIRRLRLRNVNIPSSEVMMIDDNPEMLEKISKAFPDIRCVQYGKDIVELEDMLGII